MSAIQRLPLILVVAAVRDGVTNFSSKHTFKTAERVLPGLTPTQWTPSSAVMSFPTRINRYYTIERTDALLTPSIWQAVTPSAPGTGEPVELEVPLPSNGAAFWRLRVNP